MNTILFVRERGLRRGPAQGRGRLPCHWFVQYMFGGCPSPQRLNVSVERLAVFGDAVFDPMLHNVRVLSVSQVVRSNWYDYCGQQFACQSRTL
jgi:hypothetical protein